MFDSFNLVQFCGQHWPFLVVALAIAMVGEVLKRIIMPRGPQGLSGWRWWWYTTLPLHPMLVGFVLGAFTPLPCPETVCAAPFIKGLYYSGSGILSGYVYAGVKHIGKEKLGMPSTTP